MNSTNTADPRLARGAEDDAPPALRHPRDGILPAVAAALSVRGGEVLTGTGSRVERPPALHPLVRGVLDALPVAHRERFVGRCPEPLLLSRYLTAVETRRGKWASRRPLSAAEARKALKGSRLTARRVREDGDPAHGCYAPPCRSCAQLLGYFGVLAVDPGAAG